MQAFEYTLEENIQVNCYTSFKFLQYTTPLQLCVTGENHGVVEPVAEVSNKSVYVWRRICNVQ